MVALGALLADELAELAVAQERDELRRQEDADEQRRRARDEDLAHQAPAAARMPAETASRPTPRDALTSTVSPGRTSSRRERRRGRGVGDGVHLAAVARAHVRRERPDGDQDLDAAVARVRADLGVEAQLVGAELEHVAEHGDAAPGRGRAEIVEGGAHRHRVGVVAVVDDDDGPRQLDPLAAQRAERDLERAARIGADGARRGQRRERVGAHVRGASNGSSSSPGSATSPPSPNVTTRRSSRRWRSSSGSRAGSTIVAPGRSP